MFWADLSKSNGLVAVHRSKPIASDILRKYLPDKWSKCYVLCGFEDQGWRDIATIFRRLQILWEARVIGYLMRHENHRLASPACKSIYTHLARWVNQPQFQRTVSFREFCEKSGGRALRAMTTFHRLYPAVAAEYFDSTYQQYVQ